MKIQNPQGLTIEFLENGAVRSIEATPIRINLKPGSLFSKPGINLFLRKRSGSLEYKALTGPESNSRFKIENNMYFVSGDWEGIKYRCTLQLSINSPEWKWGIEIRNYSSESMELDLVYLQDVGLKPINAGLLNEYYVSQYLERRILTDERFGAVACCRQNMKESTGNPWLMMACGNGAVSGSTDGMQFYGRTYRETGIPEGLLTESLGGDYAGESPVCALQEKPFILDPGEIHRSAFYGMYLADHPNATSPEDLKRLPGLILELDQVTPSHLEKIESQISSKNLFNSAPFLPVDDLNEGELQNYFGTEKRFSESEKGHLMSFFNEQGNHIVLRAKELLADRPHAHIMQTGSGFVPDEKIMSTTSFAFGVFNSHISQGNTNFNVLLSICTSQFNQAPESGQRIFAELDGKFYLLGVPSAFEMGLNHCRWIYKLGSSIYQVRTWTSKKYPQVNMDFKVIRGKPIRIIITHDFDPLNGWKVMPGNSMREFVAKPVENSMIIGKFKEAQFRLIIHGSSGFTPGGDELLFEERRNHGSVLFIIDSEPVDAFCMSIAGEVTRPAEIIAITDADSQWVADTRVALTEWNDLSLNLEIKSDHPDIAAIREILPWYGMNALTHFLTPYGLEQFGGAAWGTRDVSQGPVDLLLNLEKYEEARQVLCTIFSNQNPDGGWPQWWMFDCYREIRADSAHGDIYYWTLMALASYIKVTGDFKILGEILPYHHKHGTAHVEKTSLGEHVERLIGMIVDSFIPGTALVPFDGGDWNDSLQPVSKELAQRLISSWTVEMNFQAFDQYQVVYEMTGNKQKAKELYNTCEKIRSDFNRYLVKDGIVAGYGLLEEDGKISVMLHPSDQKTGIHYSILPMERGILSGIFTKEQALHHQDLIEQHLKGPDGARLMDRPLKYKGGIQEIFQRAESSTFFGREIGLMYVHEHIRYAESLAMTGKAEAFVNALRQAIPVGYRDIVPCGDIRQANCYYSSSDVHFRSRYEADERYEEALSGKMTLRGGWRVYSSGPGIYIGLVIAKLLGIRVESDNVVLDPVMPRSMDGISANLDFLGRNVKFRYSLKDGNFSPKSIKINGESISFALEENKYRQGGAVILVNLFLELLNEKQNLIDIEL